MKKNIIFKALLAFNVCLLFCGCQPINKKLLAEIYINQGTECLKQRFFDLNLNSVSNDGLGRNFDRDVDFIAAIKNFTMAIEINPDNAEAYYNRGFCYSMLNRSDQASSDFQKARELEDCD
ncbi:MAG: tetratricopeptide repeat protein [Proteobacteria bacterium]|nr:tetratricopeptide repeat protein [Pseudomonadota bacterium]